MNETELETERQQVEAVFREELCDPMTVTDGEGNAHTFRYNYDHIPEGFKPSDLELGDLCDEEFLTIIYCSLFSSPPEQIADAGGTTWQRVASCTSSGQTECTCRDCEEDPFAGEECPLCGRAVGESHGHIYIGDGWAEYVYAMTSCPID